MQTPHLPAGPGPREEESPPNPEFMARRGPLKFASNPFSPTSCSSRFSVYKMAPKESLLREIGECKEGSSWGPRNAGAMMVTMAPQEGPRGCPR